MSVQQIPERFIKFIEAATALQAEGQKVTYAAVMAKAGGRGSMTDVAAAIKLWKEQREEASQPAVVRHELPEEETKQVMDLLGAIWGKAEAQAQSVLAAERQLLDQRRAELEDERLQALDAADASLKERDAALEQVAQLQADIERIRSESIERTQREVESMKDALSAERAAAAVANARAEERERLIEVLQGQIQSLKAK